MSQVATVEKEVSEIVQVARGMIVTNNDQETFAVEFLKVIARGKKMVGDEFDDNIEKANATHKGLTAQRKKYLDPLKEADDIVRGVVKNFRLEAERKRQAEEEKVRKAMEEGARLTQERLLKEAEEAKAKGDDVKADTLARESVSVEVGGVMVASSAVKQEGMSSKVIWKGRVTDISKVPQEYLFITVNQKAIDDVGKVHSNRVAIPGVEWYQDIDMRIRA